MKITKEDIGRLVINQVGEIGKIIKFDTEEGKEGRLPVYVEFPNRELWYPTDGSTELASLNKKDTISFYTHPLHATVGLGETIPETLQEQEKTMFKNAKVGSKVFSTEFGEGYIVRIYEGAYPISVEFLSLLYPLEYTLEGYYWHSSHPNFGTDLDKNITKVAMEVKNIKTPNKDNLYREYVRVLDMCKGTNKDNLYREYVRVLGMCKGTKVVAYNCVKYRGEVLHRHPSFDGVDYADYSFAVGIVEDKPVFPGDALYVKNSQSIKDKVTVEGYFKSPKYVKLTSGVNDNVAITSLTWQEPKRTFMLNRKELPLPDSVKGGSMSERGTYFIPPEAFAKFRWDSYQDRDRVMTAITNLLKGG
jgi:hypothetical protein